MHLSLKNYSSLLRERSNIFLSCKTKLSDILLFQGAFFPRCSKILPKTFLVGSEVASALSCLTAKWEGTGTHSTLPTKQYLLMRGHGDQPWDFAYIVSMENENHGPEVTYLMSKATLFIVWFFHLLCHHSISALLRNRESQNSLVERYSGL